MFQHILLLKKQGIKYLKYNILSVLIFGVLYWLSDYIITKYPKFSKKFLLFDGFKLEGLIQILSEFLYHGYVKNSNEKNN